ncbi:MAG TPA: DsrE family protein [Burkholderiales bacterium]|nr:DsrE family protein [Burkholderiales bacterium]
MKTLFILNDPPYGSERTYNALRLAGALAKAEGNEVRVFLMGDAVLAGKTGQKVAQGFYNVQLMLDRVVQHKGQVSACGSCMEARGITANEFSEGVRRGSLDELAQWAQWADKVLVY